MAGSNHPAGTGRRCGWQRCHRPFIPARRNQIYCSADCRAAWQGWARMRGIVLVQPLIDGDTGRLERLRDELLEEVNAAREVAEKGSDDVDDG